MRFETARGTPENYIRIGFFVTLALEIMAIVGVVGDAQAEDPALPDPCLHRSGRDRHSIHLRRNALPCAEVSIVLLAAVGIDARSLTRTSLVEILPLLGARPELRTGRLWISRTARSNLAHRSEDAVKETEEKPGVRTVIGGRHGARH